MENNLKSDKLISSLIDIIKKNKGNITPAAAVSQTGYSLDEVNMALDRLIELYDACIKLNQETGNLQFIFKYPLFERGERTFGEKLTSLLNKLYSVFKVIYKAAIGMILIVYTLIFAIIIIAITLAASGNNNDDRRSNSGGFDLLALMFRAILEGMNLVAYSRMVEYAVDPNGNRYKTYKQDKSKEKGFIRSVFTFVFGPDNPKFDPLADAREVAAYIRLFTKGKLTSANIIELSGNNYPKAESRLAEYVGKFKGDLQITNDGILYGDFANMLGTQTKDERKHIEYYKDEVEPPVELTGNTGGRNFAIVAMNLFNIIMSFVIGGMSTSFVASPAANPSTMDPRIIEFVANNYQYINIGLFWFPLIFSILFFLIPIMRIPSYFVRKKQHTYSIRHKKIIGYICERRKKDFTLNEFAQYFNINSSESIDYLKNMLSKIVLELEGTIEISPNGEPIYKFERLYNELIIS